MKSVSESTRGDEYCILPTFSEYICVLKALWNPNSEETIKENLYFLKLRCKSPFPNNDQDHALEITCHNIHLKK